MKKGFLFASILLLTIVLFLNGCTIDQVGMSDLPMDEDELAAEAELLADEGVLTNEEAQNFGGQAARIRGYVKNRIEWISCYDSDKGKDYETKGTVTLKYSYMGKIRTRIFSDICSGSKVREFYCRDKRYSRTFYDCPAGCQDGSCLSEKELEETKEIKGTIICSADSDCGKNNYIGSYFCQNGDVYRYYLNNTCINAGTVSSYCYNTTYPHLIDDCGADEYCEEGNPSCVIGAITCSTNSDCGEGTYIGSYYCSNNDVYMNYLNSTCINAGTVSSYCYNTTYPYFIDDCEDGEYCAEGESSCVVNETVFNETITCSTNSDCGEGTYIGSYYCSNNDVYRNYLNSTCINAETVSSYCYNTTYPHLIDDCGADEYCVEGQSYCEQETGNQTNETLLDIIVTRITFVDTEGNDLGLSFSSSTVYHPLPTIKNNGDGVLQTSNMKYSVAHDGGVNAIGLCKEYAITLNPGEELQCDTANRGGFGNSVGTYALTINMDFYNSVGESDETNNELTTSFALTETYPQNDTNSTNTTG